MPLCPQCSKTRNKGEKEFKQLENLRDSPKKLGHNKNLNIKNEYN